MTKNGEKLSYEKEKIISAVKDALRFCRLGENQFRHIQKQSKGSQLMQGYAAKLFVAQSFPFLSVVKKK